MTARDDLVAMAYAWHRDSWRYEEAMARAEEDVNAFARELAEYLRRYRDDCKYKPDEIQYSVMSGCANLIDPEKEN